MGESKEYDADKYAFDPNSGATPQPGGFASGPVLAQDDEPTDVGADLDSYADADADAGADNNADGAGDAGTGDQTGDAEPHKGASRDEWVKWAKDQPTAEADDFKSIDEGGLRRDDLASKYGTQSS